MSRVEKLGNPRFQCVICGKDANKDWWSKDGIPPICGYCERYQTPQPKPYGDFKDRRVARQLFAVTQALETAARHKQWEGKWK